jgi:protein-disulfide isomerase
MMIRSSALLVPLFAVVVVGAVAGCPAASGPASVGGVKTSCAAASLALNDETTVAVFDGKTLTYKDLGPDVKRAEEKALRQYCDAVAGVRRIALENHVTETLVGAEAKKAGKTNEEWVRGEVDKRVPEPSDADIQAFYDKQKAAMGDQLPPLEMVKPQVIGFLKREKSESAVEEVISGLLKNASVQKKLPDVRSPPIDLNASGTTAVKGKAGAKVKVVEFADFQCPYCSKAADIVKELSAKYGDRVEFQYRHFPLRQMHPQAQRASEIAQCANEQGKFWPVHDSLYANQSGLEEENAKKLAAAAGVDEAKLTECLAAGRGAAQVDEDVAKGELAGVEGTPSFFINGRSFTGNPTVAGLASAIEEELKL